MKRKLMIALIVLLVLIQFIRPQRNNASSSSSNFSLLPMQGEVDQLLRESCYDCHSNHTSYPWYAWIQPVAWWLDDHITDGKASLNFDEFNEYDASFQIHKLEEIAAEVKSNKMPLSSYTLMHPQARLSSSEKSAIIEWTKKATKQIRMR